MSEPTSGRPTDPSKVLAREDLTVEDKIALLKDWQLDLTERMTATDENMGGTQDQGQLAEQHRHVSQALSMLEQEDPTIQSGDSHDRPAETGNAQPPART